MIFEEKEWMKNDVVGYEWINMDQIEQKMMKSEKFSNACGHFFNSCYDESQ
mgnify:CR=1 FL=1